MTELDHLLLDVLSILLALFLVSFFQNVLPVLSLLVSADPLELLDVDLRKVNPPGQGVE